MSASPHQHGALPPAESADDRAANLEPIPARVGIRSATVRLWPAKIGGAIALAVIFWLTLAPRSPELHPVQNGRRFSPAERRQAELALRDAGVTQSRHAHGQLLVPEAALAASNAALEPATASSGSTVAAWKSTNTWLDQFSTGRRQQDAVDSARAVQLGRLLNELPGVESAEVVWDEEPRVGRRQAPRVRATVFLKPEPGSAIGLDTVQAVRAAVSGSRAHLAANDVAVMDLKRRVTYDADTDVDALASEVRRAELIAACRTRIESALAGIDGLRVAVDLDVPALRDAGRVRQSADDSSAVHPAQPTGRARIAGVSGPNLRLEVARAPDAANAPTATNPTRMPEPSTSVDLPQLAVTVVLPAGHASSGPIAVGNDDTSRRRVRSSAQTNEHRRSIAEHGLRQRIADAVAGLPVSLMSSQLNVRWEEHPAATSVPVTADGTAHVLAGNWMRLRQLVTRPSFQKPAAAVLVAVSLILLGWRSIRGLRRSPENRAPDIVALHKPGRSARVPTPIDFLPEIDAATWASHVACEPTEVVAGLLRVLPPEDVADVMRQLSPVQQRDVLEWAPTASLDAQSVDALRGRIRVALQNGSPERLTPEPPHRSPTAGRVIRRSLTPDNAEAVFDDLIGADDLSLQQLASRVPSETWSAALMGASPKLHRRLSRLKLAIGRSRDAAGRRPIRLREIESAQQLIIDEWQSLELHR